ncbi:MAG: hypothetical protein WBC06_03680 [Chitinophagaceae bacterium]
MIFPSFNIWAHHEDIMGISWEQYGNILLFTKELSYRLPNCTEATNKGEINETVGYYAAH